MICGEISRRISNELFALYNYTLRACFKVFNMSSPAPEYLPSILTIDDEASIRTSFKGFLEDYDYPVIEAENGQIGLEIFSKRKPGLVLIDLNMPKMDGLQVLARIKEISPDTPTIVISGTGKLTDIAEALRLGAWDYLFKPIHDLSVLLHAVERALERAKLLEASKQYQLQLETTVQERTKELQKSEEKYRSLVANMPVGIFRYSPGEKGEYITANPAMAFIMGYNSVADLMETHPNAIYTNRPDQQELIEELFREGQVIASELLIKKSDGSQIWTSITAYLVKDKKGKVQYIDSLIEDISKRKEAEEKIRHLAFFDGLTNLPNRSLFLFNLQKALASSKRKALFGGVILIDLDRFKIINDSLGHRTGDRFIQEVAKRLQSLVRIEDTLARIGGDEFAILFSGLSDALKTTGQIIGDIADKISREMSKIFLFDEHKLYITVTIGIDIFSGETKEAEEILKHASTAVSNCKESDLGKCLFYMPNMQAAADERLIIEKELRSALKNSQLQLYYQPQVNPSGLIIGAEALIRWKHPQRGIIAPNQFIPIAETNGLIGPIGNWVLYEACRQLGDWEQLSLTKNLHHISVNVSPWQFRQPDFADTIKKIVYEAGVDPSKLMLEITEGVVISNLEDTIEKMFELKKIGIRFSIDDFGTGYSSLSYLNRLPVNELKIDHSFTQGLCKGSNFEPIVSTIIIMAANLGFDVVAEGVETKQELTYLIESSCKAFQGYYFSRPLPTREFQEILKKKVIEHPD